VPSRAAWIGLAVAAAIGAGALSSAQDGAGPLDRLRTLPGVQAHEAMQERLREGPVFVSGALNVLWADDSRSFTYARNGERHRFDLGTRTDVLVSEADRAPTATGHGPDGAADAAIRSGRVRTGDPDPCPVVVVDRGRQRSCETSPDRTRKAYYRDHNLYLSRADGTAEIAVTTDGSESSRVKYGAASWVYGEELDQRSAIWWSPDGSKVAFYRFDERPVKDYFLTLDETRIQSRVDVEAYPKAGAGNPIADVLVYDLASRRTVRLDVRGGRPFADDVVGYYVYAIEWAPDGREIRFFRTDRRQQQWEYAGCSPDSGRCRAIVRESWPTGWVENRPAIRALSGGTRFLLASDRTGWRNYYLYDYARGLIGPVTRLSGAEVESIVRVDEAAGRLYYMARDGDNFLKVQLHRVGLDGTDDVRLTDPRFTHTVRLSPDGRAFLDVYQTHDEPPSSRVVDDTGRVLAEVASSDLSRFDALGLKRVDQFDYLAADGRTRLFGTVAFPTTFDPAKRYPVLVSVYAGPESTADVPSERFSPPPPLAEYGFLVVELGTRAQPGLGRRTLDSLYLKLGRTEVDDLAAGIKALCERPYVDPERIGIEGTSYGGYAALMALLRYPTVFAAAAVSSAPTDWRDYDTIYTERYMGTPAGNAAGYDAGSALTYAADLRGRLLIYYGTADNNVHPSNALQLIQALNRAGKSYDVQVGPDLEHSALPESRMMEFFLETLVRPTTP
jgi:dipeptidyl-peptidase 4